MKTFCVIRHGKSSWDEPFASDASRPLLPVGYKRSLRVAAFLRDNNMRFDLFISSHAQRAFQTAAIVAGVLDYDESDILIEENIYHGGIEALETILLSLNDDIASVVIFGHNPTMTDFVNQYLSSPVDNFPTSAVAYFQADIEKWAELPLSQVEEVFLLTPKSLKY